MHICTLRSAFGAAQSPTEGAVSANAVCSRQVSSRLKADLVFEEVSFDIKFQNFQSHTTFFLFFLLLIYLMETGNKDRGRKRVYMPEHQFQSCDPCPQCLQPPEISQTKTRSPEQAAGTCRSCYYCLLDTHSGS